ncbi:MAG: sarcosine oxidase subunit gamma [Nocardioides sp.]
MAEPVARSPVAVAAPEVVLGGWAVSGRTSDAALTLVDCTPLSKVGVRGDPSLEPPPVGVRLGRAVRETWSDLGVLLVGAGPGEWLVLAPPGRQGEVRKELSARASPSTGLLTVVDLTHGRALFRLTGDRAADVLACETAVDLDDDLRPDGAALRCGLAGLAVDLVRDDRGGPPSYLLHCERSSGQYLFDVLLESGHEFGVDIAGFVPPGI